MSLCLLRMVYYNDSDDSVRSNFQSTGSLTDVSEIIW